MKIKWTAYDRKHDHKSKTDHKQITQRVIVFYLFNTLQVTERVPF